jgi:AcrR family transcriptional regulator
VTTLPETGTPQRRRDAAGTKQSLLDAAQVRFARHGYSATTVREIADDAGVNVALINRYFTSKEGLFEACLRGAGDELGQSVADDLSLDQVARMMAAHLAGPQSGGYPNRLLMMLRSSGDEHADRIRMEILDSFAQRLVAAAGGRPDDERVVLRAQVALSATFGVAVLRSTMALEPLASAGEEVLFEPLRDLMTALLSPS